LRIRQPEPFALPQDAILFRTVVDDLILLAMDLGGEDAKEELQRHEFE